MTMELVETWVPWIRKVEPDSADAATIQVEVASALGTYLGKPPFNELFGSKVIVIADSTISAETKPRYDQLRKDGVEVIELPGTGGLESLYPAELVADFLRSNDMAEWDGTKTFTEYAKTQFSGDEALRPQGVTKVHEYVGWLKEQLAQFVGKRITVEAFRASFPSLTTIVFGEGSPRVPDPERC